MEPGTILLLIVGGVLLWLLVDVLFTGGSMTGGMTPAPASGAGVGGMMMMASNPEPHPTWSRIETGGSSSKGGEQQRPRKRVELGSGLSMVSRSSEVTPGV